MPEPVESDLTGAPVVFAPTLTMQVLRRCACGAAHPLAQGVVHIGRLPLRCPTCDALVPPQALPVTVPAVLTGWRCRFAALLIEIGRRLSRL